MEKQTLDYAYKKMKHFIEKHPKAFPVIRSDLFLQILNSLKTAKDIIRLKSEFPFIEENDLREIMDTLIKTELATKFKASNKDFYYLTNTGKEFIEIYNETKKAFLKGHEEQNKSAESKEVIPA